MKLIVETHGDIYNLYYPIRMECGDNELDKCKEIGINVQVRTSKQNKSYVGQLYYFSLDESSIYDLAIKMIKESSMGDNSLALVNLRHKIEDVRCLARILIHFKDIEIVYER